MSWWNEHLGILVHVRINPGKWWAVKIVGDEMIITKKKKEEEQEVWIFLNLTNHSHPQGSLSVFRFQMEMALQHL